MIMIICNALEVETLNLFMYLTGACKRTFSYFAVNSQLLHCCAPLSYRNVAQENFYIFSFVVEVSHNFWISPKTFSSLFFIIFYCKSSEH